MNSSSDYKSKKHVPWLLLVFLIILQVVLGKLVLDQQQESLSQTHQRHARSDMVLLKSEVRDALQRKDYVGVSHFLKKWGGMNAESVTELKLSAANGFVISRYLRPEPAAETFLLTERISYSYKGEAVLAMVRDMGAVRVDMARLTRILVLAGGLITVFSAYMIRLVFLRQREALVLHKRTIELDEANRRLEDEVEERCRTEEALEFSNIILVTQQETSLDGILVVDEKGRVLSHNQRFVDMWGLSLDNLKSETVEQMFTAVLDDVADSEKFIERVRYLVAHPEEKYSDEIVLKDGRIFDRYSAPMLGKDGRYYGRVGYFRDITERRKAQDALAEEKERLAVTLRSIGEAVITTDIEGDIVLMNKAAEKLTGWTQQEAVGLPLHEIFNVVYEKTLKPCENPVESVLVSGEIVERSKPAVLIAKDGSKILVADSGAPIRDRMSRVVGVVLVFRDVTLEQRMKEELFRARKVESIGLLAGGIAHDFNNILTAITGNISLVKSHVDPGDKIFDRLGAAEKACERAQNLTQQLITFSKGGAPIRRTASVADILADTVGFVLKGSNVKCELSVPDDLWLADIDEGQISQVIGNLVINADQAMVDGGTMTVRAENMTAGAADMSLKEGDYVKVSVEDKGVGIPPENIAKIFDPYFSTKEKGSGLGLASTYSIVKNHDGLVTVDSQLGRGSTFSVFLPASGKKMAREAKAPKKVIIHGTGRVLIMDDEETVRNTLSSMLEFMGYEPELTEDGKEAVDIYQQAMAEGRSFAAVILDLTVPGGMGGQEAIRELLALDPEVRAIVSSGYSSDSVMADYRAYGFCGVIVKPYDMRELSHALAEVCQEAQV